MPIFDWMLKPAPKNPAIPVSPSDDYLALALRSLGEGAREQHKGGGFTTGSKGGDIALTIGSLVGGMYRRKKDQEMIQQQVADQRGMEFFKTALFPAMMEKPELADVYKEQIKKYLDMKPEDMKQLAQTSQQIQQNYLNMVGGAGQAPPPATPADPLAAVARASGEPQQGQFAPVPVPPSATKPTVSGGGPQAPAVPQIQQAQTPEFTTKQIIKAPKGPFDRPELRVERTQLTPTQQLAEQKAEKERVGLQLKEEFNTRWARNAAESGNSAQALVKTAQELPKAIEFLPDRIQAQIYGTAKLGTENVQMRDAIAKDVYKRSFDELDAHKQVDVEKRRLQMEKVSPPIQVFQGREDIKRTQPIKPNEKLLWRDAQGNPPKDLGAPEQLEQQGFTRLMNPQQATSLDQAKSVASQMERLQAIVPKVLKKAGDTTLGNIFTIAGNKVVAKVGTKWAGDPDFNRFAAAITDIAITLPMALGFPGSREGVRLMERFDPTFPNFNDSIQSAIAKIEQHLGTLQGRWQPLGFNIGTAKGGGTKVGEIRVREKTTGRTGKLPENEFDPVKYERIQ